MSEQDNIETEGDLLTQAEGRARFLRDRGEIKTPELLERLRSELKQAREIIGAFVQTNDDEMPLGLCDQVDNTGEPYQSQHFADLVSRARAFLTKGDQNDG